jgi:hypothetical protein
MVYYLLEDALVPSSLAAKYFRLAAKWNGNEAYTRLHDGFVFAGPQTMSLLLAQLVKLRFSPDESASGFCLRLREIFEDLEMVPGESSVVMNDTQKIGYLLSGIRQEKSLEAVYVALQDKQLRGGYSFEEACSDLHHRCDAIRADEMLDTPVRGQQKVLISTQAKRQNKEAPAVDMGPCLQKGCSEEVKLYLPLCPKCYHQCISGKTPEVELRDGLGKAKFNVATQVIDYPSTVPKNRFPLPRSERPRKAMVFHGALLAASPVGSHAMIQEGGTPPPSSLAIFYIDSGAGQCLCSCSSAFVTMEACHLQVVGVTGRLTIHGQGTAVFLVTVNGQEALLRIHNCLHNFGEVNLISASRLKLIPGNYLDFSVVKPFMRLSQDQSDWSDQSISDVIEIPLSMDDGLYSLCLEPVTPSDPRYSDLQVFDITPPGQFVPVTTMLCAVPGPADAPVQPAWTTEVLSSPTSGRVFALNSSLDFDAELRIFSDGFLAPAAIPPARRQYDVGEVTDMTELSIRFMGPGTDVWHQTPKLGGHAFDWFMPTCIGNMFLV